MKVTPLSLLPIVALLPGTGFAQGWEAEEPDVQHDMSLTLSPAHLALRTAELKLEKRYADDFGLALIIGGGAPESGDSTVGVFEAGGQAMYYAAGSFIRAPCVRMRDS